MKCPCCKGTGKVETKTQRTVKQKEILAKKLRKVGLSYTEIMKALFSKVEQPNQWPLAPTKPKITHHHGTNYAKIPFYQKTKTI